MKDMIKTIVRLSLFSIIFVFGMSALADLYAGEMSPVHGMIQGLQTATPETWGWIVIGIMGAIFSGIVLLLGAINIVKIVDKLKLW